MVTMKLEVSHEDERIYFTNKEFGYLGYTNYVKEFYEKIEKVNWYVQKKEDPKDKCYIYTGSTKLGKHKMLHQIVMIHWYGQEKFDEACKKKFIVKHGQTISKKSIVEHHDNEEHNCLIENLSFAPDNVNKAKGLTYDQERIEAMPDIAINFFKDFKTQKYQITLGFNKDISIQENGKSKSITALYLVYKGDFRIVINDASNLLYNLMEYEKFALNKLQFIDYKYTETIYIQKYEDMPPMVEIDGKMVHVLDERTQLVSISPDPEFYKED